LVVEGAILIVSADVIPGKEEEFNKWYDEHHIPEYSGKMPYVKAVRRYYSKRSNPQFIAVYEYDSYDNLKKSMASEESNLAGEDADKQIGVLVKSFTFNPFSLIFSYQS
jgi:antibiotic biosynthesis monooxygenase (ABM) superfamily enzyme